MASCLTAGDKLGLPEMGSIVSILFGGLYGSCLMAEDEKLMLKLLHHLMRSQLATAVNPRKLMRQQNCAFTRLFKVVRLYSSSFPHMLSSDYTNLLRCHFSRCSAKNSSLPGCFSPRLSTNPFYAYCQMMKYSWTSNRPRPSSGERLSCIRHAILFERLLRAGKLYPDQCNL